MKGFFASLLCLLSLVSSLFMAVVAGERLWRAADRLGPGRAAVVEK